MVERQPGGLAWPVEQRSQWLECGPGRAGPELPADWAQAGRAVSSAWLQALGSHTRSARARWPQLAV